MAKKSPVALMWDVVGANVNLSVPWYLMASYAYYELDSPFIPDGDFDDLAKLMLSRWDDIQHPHKDYITKDDLKGGTLLRRDYPEITKDAAIRLLS